MYEDFLSSGDEWLFNADSDLIYRTDIIEAIDKNKDSCGGFMTFFNCIGHEDSGETNLFVEKKDVGAAGCLLRRDNVKNIIDNILYRSISFDVAFSDYLSSHDITLFATKESYVQHIGVNGYNSQGFVFDYGRNFKCDNMVNAEIIEKTFEEYIASVDKFKNDRKWRVYNSFVNTVPRKKDRYSKLILEIFNK
jgi:hypothetical protein